MSIAGSCFVAYAETRRFSEDVVTVLPAPVVVIGS